MPINCAVILITILYFVFTEKSAKFFKKQLQFSANDGKIQICTVYLRTDGGG